MSMVKVKTKELFVLCSFFLYKLKLQFIMLFVVKF